MDEKKNILIVDDDMHIGNMLEETLRLEGYEVSRAYSGTEALMVLNNSRPDHTSGSYAAGTYGRGTASAY